MTEKQKAKVAALVERFNAESHHVSTGGMLNGLPSGWVLLELYREGRQPYVLGISPEGDSHS